MSRQKFEKTFNTFTKGLMTEASELNFPEDFSLYEKNFLLHRDGGRDRRKGMELVYPLGVMLTSKPYDVEVTESIALSPALVTRAEDRRQARDMSGEDHAVIQAGVGWLKFRGLRADVSADDHCQLGTGLSRFSHSRALVSHSSEDHSELQTGLSSLSLRVAAIDTQSSEEIELSTSLNRMNFYET